jgi:glycosyltransferase involved in cell wall biosynthesis
MSVDVDIIIPTFGRPLVINETLRMLLGQETLPKKTIVVNQTPGVDSPDPGIREAYREARVDLIWINRKSPSLCGARNDALHASTAEICLFLDDDVIVPPDLVRKHRERYSDGSGWVAVGGQVCDPSGFSPELISSDKPYAGAQHTLLIDEMIPGGPLFGGHFSVRRETALAIGGWDESFVGSANWEEGDFIHRLRARGYAFVWDPAPWIIHLKLPFGGCRIPGNPLFPEWTKSTNFFLYKYRYPDEKSWRTVLQHALRAGPLRKEVVLSPRRWPVAWSGFFKGWRLGKQNAGKPILPLLSY